MKFGARHKAMMRFCWVLSKATVAGLA